VSLAGASADAVVCRAACMSVVSRSGRGRPPDAGSGLFCDFLSYGVCGVVKLCIRWCGVYGGVEGRVGVHRAVVRRQEDRVTQTWSCI
jgi:hypothetical protein